MIIFDGKNYVEVPETEITAMKDAIVKAEAEEKHRPLTEAEVNAMLIRQQINTLTVEDATALRMKSFYPAFSQVIGQTVKSGFKFTYDGKLYKTIQPELTLAEHYPPGTGTESLYTEICESHDGSRYDPIPYSGNMALEEGKYYTQNGMTYLCILDTGNPVYNNLSDLVGLYVEEI